MTSTLFYGFGAYVGRVHGCREIEWWPADPDSLGWDEDKLIRTRLAHTPLGLAGGIIGNHDEIEVDDHLSDDGLTQIGPRYPQGEMVGVIWLSRKFYNDMDPAIRPPRHQTTDGYDYELTSILHWNSGRPDRRYFGFRGKVIKVNGSQLELDVWHGGRGRIPNERPNRVLVDQTEIEPALSQISRVGDDGAIYIEATKARYLQLRTPKRPEASGSDFY